MPERSESNGQRDWEQVRMIGGNPYRTGFFAAAWGDLNPENPRTLLKAKRENVLAHSSDLFHYTTLPGLKGIIEENGFWASDNRFMNDTEESLNGVRLAREILRHKIKRSRSSEFSLILAEVDRLIASPKEHGHLISCFSTVRDDLGQWRGYASDGVCLRLGTPGQLHAPLFFGPDHSAYEAIYHDDRKRILLFSIIRTFEREYAIDRDTMPLKWPDDHDEEYTKQLYKAISGRILGFKDRAFEKEAEVRLILSYSDIDRYDGGLRFRASRLGIIPYLRTGDHVAIKKHGGRMPLYEVIVGPSPHQELIAQSLKTFLTQRGYAETLISLSKVPYRAP